MPGKSYRGKYSAARQSFSSAGMAVGHTTKANDFRLMLVLNRDFG
jgi:hypothetical protein